MKKYHYLWFAVCFGFVILFASCAKERSEGGDSNETPSGKLVASGERITLPVFSKGDISAYIQSALSSRFVAQTAELEKARVMLFSTESFVAANPQQLVEAYDRGVVFVIARPDMEQVERICNENDIPFGGAITNKNDLELFAFNSRGDSYSMDDPSDSNLSAQEEYNAYLNPFISWLNDILTKGASVQAAPDLRTEPQADVQKTFDYQTISHTFNVYLKKELGTVALSTPDTVEASGQVTLTMSIYPLYAFTDQSSPGDYYIVNTTLTAHNQTLYLGEFEHRHGGVHVHMCAYIMGHMNMTCTMDSKAGYTVDFPINGTPTPLTTQVSQTFTSGISWNLGGSLTGGLDATGPSVSATVNGGVTFENSTSTTVPDLIIQNNWTGATMKSDFSVDVDARGYVQGYALYAPSSFLCKSNMEVNPAWIWHVGGTKDGDTTSFTGQCKVYVTYSSMRYYTSVLDSKIPTYYDGIPTENQTFFFRLHAPNRVPTGSMLFKNTNDGGVYVTNIKLWKEGSDYTAAPLYAYTESVAPGNEMSQSIATGKYRIQIEMGPNASSLKTYHTPNAVTITRGESSTVNSGFDFQEGAL